MAEGIFKAGKYEVKTGNETQTVEVDRFEYRGQHETELHAIKDNETIAIFKWWESVTLKD